MVQAPLTPQDTTKEEKKQTRTNFFEKQLMPATLEPFTLISRAVSVRKSLFNPAKLRSSLAHIHQLSSSAGTLKETLQNGQIASLDLCHAFLSRALSHSVEASTRAAGHRLVGHVISPHSPSAASAMNGLDALASIARTKAQWAVTAEDPRLRLLLGREVLPRRLSMLRSDAIDYRTHSFEVGYFRLSRVGALEVCTDEHAHDERSLDVDYKHVGHIQQLISAMQLHPEQLLDQPSSYYCFRLEFPPDVSALTKAQLAACRFEDLPSVFVTLAAFSSEVFKRERDSGCVCLRV